MAKHFLGIIRWRGNLLSFYKYYHVFFNPIYEFYSYRKDGKKWERKGNKCRKSSTQQQSQSSYSLSNDHHILIFISYASKATVKTTKFPFCRIKREKGDFRHKNVSFNSIRSKCYVHWQMNFVQRKMRVKAKNNDFEKFFFFLLLCRVVSCCRVPERAFARGRHKITLWWFWVPIMYGFWN